MENILQIIPHKIDDEGGVRGSEKSVIKAIGSVAKDVNIQMLTLPQLDAPLGNIGDPAAKFESGISNYASNSSNRLFGQLIQATEDGSKILSVGGNHLRAVELIGYLKACHQMGLEPMVLWIDAHPDLHTPETSSTGNIHGMVASLLFGEGPEKIASQLGDTPPLKPENLIYIGVNQADPAEMQRIKDKGIAIITMEDLEKTPGNNSIIELISDKVDKISNKKAGIWLEVDVDVLRTSESPGAVMDNHSGMSLNQLKYLIYSLSQKFSSTEKSKILGMGICEIAPSKDRNGVTINAVRDFALGLFGVQEPDYHSSIPNRSSHTGPSNGIVNRTFKFARSNLPAIAAVLALAGTYFFKTRENPNVNPIVPKKDPMVRVLTDDAQYAYTGIPSWSKFIPIPFKGEELTSKETMNSLVQKFLETRDDRNTNALLSYLRICEYNNLSRWESLEGIFEKLGTEGQHMFRQLKDSYQDLHRDTTYREVGDFNRIWNSRQESDTSKI